MQKIKKTSNFGNLLSNFGNYRVISVIPSNFGKYQYPKIPAKIAIRLFLPKQPKEFHLGRLLAWGQSIIMLFRNKITRCIVSNYPFCLFDL